MQYTSITQSQRLIKLGLSPQTADMRYGYVAPYEYSDRMFDGGYDEIPCLKGSRFFEDEYDDELPCWSLGSLLKLLPIPYQMTRNKDGMVQLMLMTFLRKDYFDNELEAAYSMLVWLLENDLLNKEILQNYGSKY